MKDEIRPSVLIVDDQVKNLQVLADMLQEKKYNVAMAKDGDKALTFIKRRRPDLILLDVMMPEMDGFEVCRRLKKEEETKDIPVIFISALTDTSDKIRAFHAGGVDYVTKPFRKEEVFARVSTHLDLRRSYENLRRMNSELKTEISERERAEAALRKAHEEMTASIRYAEMIQRSLLPDREDIMGSLPDSFFIWMPKDIVGGDMIFAEVFEEESILAVIDCAGHGVPGAFLTMIAVSALRRITKDEGCRSPGDILKRLNVIVKTTLRQDTDHALSDDGLEAAVCAVRGRQLVFAGAKLPLFCVINGDLRIIGGDRQNIGYKRSDLDFDFREHTVDIERGMNFYMATDGFKDQIGGIKNEKSRFGFACFGKERFANLLREVSALPFDRQKEVLLRTFDEYKGDRERQDDIAVLGFGFA